MSGRRTMAQMWQQVDHLKDVIRRQHDKAEKRNAEIKAFKAENAKLRELLGELYQCSRQVGCDHCGEGYRRICSSLSRMHELGIEVTT